MELQLPLPGFYYHYKHDPNGLINEHAYEVLNIAHHTEIDGLEESAMVVYRPIYESSVYKVGKHWDARPLESFIMPVIQNDKTIERFQKITDPEVISKLKTIRDSMYGLN